MSVSFHILGWDVNKFWGWSITLKNSEIIELGNMAPVFRPVYRPDIGFFRRVQFGSIKQFLNQPLTVMHILIFSVR
jgi:hypothetical protein